MVEVSSITKNPIAETEILKIFKCLCQGVNAFHKLDPPFAHRDIKVWLQVIVFIISLILLLLFGITFKETTSCIVKYYEQNF